MKQKLLWAVIGLATLGGLAFTQQSLTQAQSTEIELITRVDRNDQGLEVSRCYYFELREYRQTANGRQLKKQLPFGQLSCVPTLP